MRLVVEKDMVLNALKNLKPSVSNDVEEVTSHVLFDVGPENQLTIKGSNNFVYTSLSFGMEDGVIESEGNASFTVDLVKLSKWVKNVMDDDIEFLLEDGKLSARCGSFETPLPTMNAKEFPSSIFDPEFESSEEISTIMASLFIESITFISKFVSDSTSNSDPTGKFKVAQLRDGEFQGTNSKVLGIFKSDSLGCDIKVGYDQIRPVLSYLKRFSENQEMKITKSDNFFFLSANDGSYFGYVIPRNDLPKLTSIPTELVERDVWNVKKDSVEQAIGALKAVADPEDMNLSIKLEGTDGDSKMTFSKRAALNGNDAVASFGCERIKSSGETLSISVSHDLIENALSSYGDNISIAYNGASNYIKFYEETEVKDLKLCLIALRPQ